MALNAEQAGARVYVRLAIEHANHDIGWRDRISLVERNAETGRRTRAPDTMVQSFRDLRREIGSICWQRRHDMMQAGSRWLSRVVGGYGVAVLSVFVAVALIVTWQRGVENAPGSVFFFAVMLSAWRGGLRAGLEPAR